jgi:DNA primase
MLAKLTSKNQLTLPKSMVEAVGHPDYFQVDLDNGRLVLTPAKVAPADAVRRKLEELGISEIDIEDAVGRARR